MGLGIGIVGVQVEPEVVGVGSETEVIVGEVGTEVAVVGRVAGEVSVRLVPLKVVLGNGQDEMLVNEMRDSEDVAAGEDTGGVML